MSVLCFGLLLTAGLISAQPQNWTFTRDESIHDIDWIDFSAAAPTDAIPIQMTTSANEKYTCFLPNPLSSKSSEKPEGAVKEKHPFELLKTLGETCATKVESYWSYEVCFDQHVRQYHEEDVTDNGKKTKKVNDFYLGKSKALIDSLEQIKSGKHPTPQPLEDFDESFIPKMTIDGRELPYYSQIYRGGTLCDLTNQPRETEVRFICDNNEFMRYALHSETSTCVYRAIIFTNRLCSHPKFLLQEDRPQKIICKPNGPRGDPVPDGMRSLMIDKAALETERIQRSQRINAAKNQQKLHAEEQALEQHEMAHNKAHQDALKLHEEQHTVHARGPQPPHPSQPPKPSQKPAQPQQQQQHPGTPVNNVASFGTKPGSQVVSKQTLLKFLKEHHCFTGSNGWWNYEYCFGKQVTQYHVNEDKSKTVVLLGKWNEKYHREMYKKHRPDAGSKTQVTHYFEDGQHCDEIGASRNVQVKMVCSKTLVAGQIGLVLQEPSICRYILRLESQLFCDLSTLLDEDGVLLV